MGLIDYHVAGSVAQSFGDTQPKYVDKMCILIRWLEEHGYKVQLLISDVTYDTPVRNDLIQALEKRGTKYAPGQFIDEMATTVEELRTQIARTDVIVSPRFHTILLALMAGKPAISISCNQKTDSLMAGVGFGQYCHCLNELDLDKLVRQVVEIGSNVASITPSIIKEVEEYRWALDEQYGRIFAQSVRERINPLVVPFLKKMAMNVTLRGVMGHLRPGHSE